MLFGLPLHPPHPNILPLLSIAPGFSSLIQDRQGAHIDALTKSATYNYLILFNFTKNQFQMYELFGERYNERITHFPLVSICTITAYCIWETKSLRSLIVR